MPLDLSRRQLLQLAATSAASVALPLMTETARATAAAEEIIPGYRARRDLVLINYNENPHGPCEAARAAAQKAVTLSGRYLFEMEDALARRFADQNGLKPDYVTAYAGSTDPLNFSVLAFTSPTRGIVVANPTFEQAAQTAAAAGAPVREVPLTADYAHDVDAMLAADPNAGVYYICTPNNPTGTVTGRDAIEKLLAAKPAGAILLVDEAYIHFSDAVSCIDLVAAGKDIIVLRTFSKLYGMAGLRCGLAIGRPDLLKKLHLYGTNPLSVPAMTAAIASLDDKELVPTRKKENASIRESTIAWLRDQGFKVIPSASNCFMFDTGRPGKEFTAAMAENGVVIGRSWPIWPTWVRVTVGTAQEMKKFRHAVQLTMGSCARKAASEGSTGESLARLRLHLPELPDTRDALLRGRWA